ncbi:IS1 family transposase [Hymenobacter sp. BT664]|uniref:IS1 family transposase n=1 Tax=Hymenobacter montanus TaxID=2771359 RepID=A0A927BAB6_9BACT|nr:IS1 family transposase [Hymenobacter montanus]MBD2767016.1 IS1 family transposase [Hymenobacter montanus]
MALDEMWTFGGQRRRKVWLWRAVERASRRVVAWAGATRLRPGGLWWPLPKRYRRHCWYFTDLFPAYAQALPAGPHRSAPKAKAKPPSSKP